MGASLDTEPFFFFEQPGRHEIGWKREDKPYLSKKPYLQSSEEMISSDFDCIISMLITHLAIHPVRFLVYPAVPSRLVPPFFAYLASLSQALDWREMRRNVASSRQNQSLFAKFE